MIYADYEYYKDTYKGKMTQPDFERLSRQASAYLDRVTFERAEKAVTGVLEGKIKDACCAVCDSYLLNEQGGGVVSETVGRLTRNYAAGISNTPTEGQRLYASVSLYLAGTGLMYRG